MTQLSIQHLGPHGDLALDIPDHAAIVGPSQAGKSMILQSLCLLIGATASDGGSFPVELIREDADAATVRWGPLSRRVSKSGSKRGTVAGDSYGSQRDWAAALGSVGEDWTDIGIHIVSPMSWVPLASKSGGRGLSTLLRAVLPDVDMREIVADMMADVGGIRPGDPLILKGHCSALVLQKTKNAEASEAQGRLAEATAALAGMPTAPTAPDPKRVAKAVEYLDTLKIWAAYSTEVKQHEALVAASAQGAAAVDRWDAAIADLGDCPPDPGAADESQVDLATRKHAAAVDQRYAVSGKIEKVRLEGKAAISAHREKLREAAEALAAHKATQPAVECGTCGQPLPSAEAAAEHHTARTAELTKIADEWIAKPEPKPADLGDLEAELVKLEGKVEKAKAGITAARKVVDAHKSEAQAAAEWRRARARIGDRPQAVTIPNAPSKPAGTAPPAHHEDTARALIAASKTHQRDLAAWEKRKGAAEARIDALAVEASEAQAEAARVVEICKALRLAPGVAAAGNADVLASALRGTGVSIVWAEEGAGGPEVQVYVDGRPWVCASDGRQIMADLAIRLMLRKLAADRYVGKPLRYAGLPVIVDRAQAWSGRWPPARALGGPVWRLVTSADVSAVEVRSW